MGGSAHDLEALDLDRLAPVQLDDVGDVALLQPRLDAEGDNEERIEGTGEPPDGRLVEVIVMVM